MQRPLSLNSSGLLQETDFDANLFINPTFEINQIGSSSYSINTSTVNLFSQWEGARVGTAVCSVAYGDVPSVNQVGGYQGNSLLATVTTAQSTLGSNDLVLIGQKFEGYNFRRIVGRPFTLSFWVKSNKVGIHAVSIRNANVSQSFVATYQVLAANTWERKVITVPVPPVTSGTWNYLNGLAFTVHWSLCSGTNYVTAQPNSWQAGNFVTAPNQVNVCDTVNNTFQLALIKLEPGAIATPFRYQDYLFELRRCERFYCRSTISIFQNCTVTEVVYSNLSLPTWMRTLPSTSLISAPNRTNLSATNIPILTFYNNREGYFYMAAASAGYYGTLGEIWEANARL